MALSGYDRDRDGRCDAPACRGVLALVRKEGFGRTAADEVVGWLSAIGIDLRTAIERTGDFYTRLYKERMKTPIAMGRSYGYGYANASDVLPTLFASSAIAGGLGWNSSLLGATSSQLRQWGYDVTAVPSVDDRIDRCMAMTGRDQTGCWAELDRYLMEDVLPEIPYGASETTMVVSKRVASFSYSVPTAGLALDRIALVPGSD
jgi:hypothetical protein